MSRFVRPALWSLVAAAGLSILALARIRADEPVVRNETKFLDTPSSSFGSSPLSPPASTNTSQKADGPKRPDPNQENLGRMHGEQPRNPRALFITDKASDKSNAELARLAKPDGEFETMKAAGWLIGEGADNDVQVVDRRLVPELAKELQIQEYPAVCCINHGKIVRSFKSGCTTPLDAWTFSWLIKGVDERPTAPVLEAATVETTGHYPLRGNHWSVNGDWNPTREEVLHILRGPNHAASLLPQWQIDSWSLEELRSLHDNLHESDPNYNPYASSGSSSPSSQRSWQDHKSKGER